MAGRELGRCTTTAAGQAQWPRGAGVSRAAGGRCSVFDQVGASLQRHRIAMTICVFIGNFEHVKSLAASTIICKKE